MVHFNKEESSSKIKVLHLLQQSLPNNAGYSIRSHYLLKHQKKFLTPYALTRPFFIRNNDVEVYNGVKYHRFPRKLLLELINSLFYTKYFWKKLFFKYSIENILMYLFFDVFKVPSRFIEKLVKKNQVDIIHGHTPHIFSRMGYNVSLKLKLPFIYEVRGFWEETKVALGVYKQNGEDYIYNRRKETDLMSRSDAVVTLGEEMSKEIVRRGIDPKKVHVIPNGVDVDRFKPLPTDESLKESLGLSGKFLIGYIGSIRRIEGIEYLIRSLKFLRGEIENLEILLVGSCGDSYKRDLEELARKEGIADKVNLVGRIPVEQVNRYYSILDIVVIPRINARVNRLVTPLKQLEAMAMEKVVITSDLPALKEMIKPGISGDYFKAEDAEDLARKIKLYALDDELNEKLGKSARFYVIKHHSWKHLVKMYLELYKSLL